MNNIDKKFRELTLKGRKAFIAYITAGDPNLKTTRDLSVALEKAGVDILEIGIPFSDPLADGPTIQAASYRALKNKVNLDKIFAMAGALHVEISIPLVFMTYYNPIFKYGLDRFMKGCRENGVAGVIIPDLPYEESSDLSRLAKKYGISAISLIAPTSTPARIKNIIKSSTGFIYYVSLTGVTGSSGALPADAAFRIKAVKRMTGKPVCVGFGVSTPAQAAVLARAADGVIVGSAIVKIISEGGQIKRRVREFANKLAEAIHGT